MNKFAKMVLSVALSIPLVLGFMPVSVIAGAGSNVQQAADQANIQTAQATAATAQGTAKTAVLSAQSSTAATADDVAVAQAEDPFAIFDQCAAAPATATEDVILTAQASAKKDISSLIGSYYGLKLTYGPVRYYMKNWGDDTPVQFLYTGNVIKPRVIDTSDEAYREGKDYKVTYKDAKGKAVASPKAKGKYTAIITPMGRLTGEAVNVPFEIVSKYTLDGYFANFSYLGDYSSDYRYLAPNMNPQFYGYIDSNTSVSALRAVEGYDYTLKTSKVSNQKNANSNGAGLFKIVATGIGRFAGTLTTKFFNAAPKAIINDMSVHANSRYCSENDTPDTVSAVVYVDSKGKMLSTNDINVYGTVSLIQGVDYDLGTLSAVTPRAYEDGSYGYATLTINGMGTYKGAKKSVLVKVMKKAAEAPAASKADDYDLSGAFMMYIKEGVRQDNDFYLPKTVTKPEVSVRTSGYEKLVEGVHYKVKYTRNAAKTKGTITITAIPGSGCKGTLKTTVKLVSKYDISKWVDVSTEEPDAYSSGKTGKNNLNLVYYGYKYGVNPVVSTYVYQIPNMQLGKDYTLTLKNSKGTKVSQITGPGDYKLVITGKGKWKGSKTVPVYVADGRSAPQQISTCSVKLDESNRYNGAYYLKAKPAVTVSYGDYVLQQGTDYTLSYKNNTKVGKACVVITAKKGNKKGFIGSTAVEYTIVNPKDISTSYNLEMLGKDGSYQSVRYSVYGAAPIEQVDNKFSASNVRLVAYKYNNLTGDQEESVLNPKYYKVTYGITKTAGKAFLKVAGKNGYKGTSSANFHYVKHEHAWKPTAWKWNKAHTKATATLACSKDKTHKKTVSAKMSTTTSKGKVYRVATVTLNGKSYTKKYCLKEYKAFTSATLSKSTFTYDGKEKKPTVTVKYGKAKLVEGRDYTVTYDKGRIKPGTYKVTVKGKGNYMGTTVLTMTINPKK